MKKLIFIVLLMMTGLIAGAQEGEWFTGMNEADELKGQAGCPYFLYEVEGLGSFVVWDWNDWSFKINTSKGVFDVWYYERTGNAYINVIMGLYTLDGKLTDKFEDKIQSELIHQTSAWLNKKWIYSWSQEKKLKKMIRALKSGDGYVRIVCSRKGAPDFDLKVMPYKEPSVVEDK